MLKLKDLLSPGEYYRFKKVKFKRKLPLLVFAISVMYTISLCFCAGISLAYYIQDKPLSPEYTLMGWLNAFILWVMFGIMGRK